MTYYSRGHKGIALLFLLLFLNGFMAETMAYEWTDLCQSELVDFEGEKDTEEDAKNEKEKENKILDSSDPLAHLNQRNPSAHAHKMAVIGDQIHEVLSPPPERC